MTNSWIRLAGAVTAGAALTIGAAAATHPEHEPNSVQSVKAGAAQSVQTDEAQVRAVLEAYKNAIERLDATGTEQFFTADSVIFETGGSEGSYANYLSHHLGPELKEFKSFSFSDHKMDVQLLGPTAALATETYKYRIETKSGEVAERLGVATSVLRKENGQWKIVMAHNSARRPRPAS
jgi:uncharacterized protein (TIGR02246 family)